MPIRANVTTTQNGRAKLCAFNGLELLLEWLSKQTIATTHTIEEREFSELSTRNDNLF